LRGEYGKELDPLDVFTEEMGYDQSFVPAYLLPTLMTLLLLGTVAYLLI